VRAEQKRLAKAVAMTDGVAELATELRRRSHRIQHLEGQIVAARRTPAELALSLSKSRAPRGRSSRTYGARSRMSGIGARCSWPCSRMGSPSPRPAPPMASDKSGG
jgi:hypothetical protein